jgi:hypothetical protein
MITSETIVLIIPLVLLELFLKILCFRDWLHREHFKGLPRTAWLVVFLIVNFFGPVAYLSYGRKPDGDH